MHNKELSICLTKNLTDENLKNVVILKQVDFDKICVQCMYKQKSRLDPVSLAEPGLLISFGYFALILDILFH